MSSPFNVFRKHQKAILAVVCVICMVVFTVDMGLRQSNDGPGGVGSNAVLATWKYGTITQGEIDVLRDRTQSLAELFSLIQQEVQTGGGRTKAPLAEYLNLSVDDRTLVNDLLLSKRAEELGINFNDEALMAFIRTFSDDKIGTEEKLSKKLTEFGSTPRTSLHDFHVADVFYILRIQLQAAAVRQLATAGISTVDDRFPSYAPRILPATPAAAYEYYLRFNRKLKAEVLPLRVEDYVAKVTQSPTKEELEKLYEEGKDRFPNPNSDEPGFMHRARAQFAYVKIPYEPFVTEAAKTITDAQVQEYYDKNKDNFRKLDLLTSPDDLKPEANKPAPEAKPDEAQPDVSKPEAKPGETKPDAAAPEAEKSEKPAATAAPSAADKPAAAPETAPAGGEKEKAAEKPQVLHRPLAHNEVFVLAEGSEQTPAAGAAEEKKAAETPAAAAPAATEKAPATAPAGEKPAEKGPEKPAVKPAEKPVQYKPLAEVRPEIVKTLARFPAQQAFQAAVNEVRNVITDYSTEYTKWKVSREKDKTLKPFPSLDTLLTKYHAVQGDTGMIDELEALNCEMGKLHPQFYQMVTQPGILPYRPQVWGNVQSDPEVFVYWKTGEDEKAFTPKFDQAEPAVLQAWKMQQALVLAKADAEKISREASKELSGEPGKKVLSLKEALPADLRNRVIDTNEFSWLQNLGGGFGRSQLGTVVGVNTPGEDFMRAVCSLKYNDVGVAVNQPHTEVYVVRISSDSPTATELRKNFTVAGLTFTSNEVATHEVGGVLQKWLKEMESDMKLDWKRAPMAMNDQEG